MCFVQYFKLITMTGAVSIGLSSAANHELLNLNFDNAPALGAQTGLVPLGTLYGDVTVSSLYSGAADFGANGRILFGNFSSPKGSFSIESKFFLKGYAPVSSRYISDLVNTSSWDTLPSQGFVIRIGGGYLYSPLPRSAFASDAEYQASNALYSNTDKAYFSRCLGHFGMQGTPTVWKGVYTDRCVELNKWNHVVGTWDGKDVRIYLNGREVTDQLRIDGAGLAPFMFSVAPLTVGARTLGDYDSRHFNGLMDFVRIADTSMSPSEIQSRYFATLTSEERTRACNALLPAYPTGGRCIGKNDDFHVRLGDRGGCTSIPAWQRGDTIDVELAKNALFDSVFMSFAVIDTLFKLPPSLLVGKDQFAGPTFWRVKSRRFTLAKTSAVALSDWSLSAPIMLNMQSSSTVTPISTRARRLVVQGGQIVFLPRSEYPRQPKLYGLNGNVIPAAFNVCEGGWCLLGAFSSAPGMFLVE